ncbi:MAG: FliI/YscN family ATPase [Bryobacteraceae bacterium]|nr:FliI/YscN family ATPase [Solibacteraceae bacterium]MCO5354067.1 FliI/YscN family ATPase [Bryobacteraceae bacterium]
MTHPLDLHRYQKWLSEADSTQWTGTVTETIGLIVETRGPAAAVGDFCEILTRSGRRIRTQVIGFREGRLLSMPLEETGGLQSGDKIVARKRDSQLAVSHALLGRVLDGFGRPLDQGPPLSADAWYDLYAPPPGPLEREPIEEPLSTGIRAIDAFLTCGRGQRVGIFGGSGVGKSTLLGNLLKNHNADVAVLALVGERNREVRDFIEHELGPEGLRRSVLVVATSDRPSPLRVRACFVALAIAEFFRDQGKDVLLVADSVTRLAMAQREIGLAGGEPPSQKGYTPSVFQMLPRIFERAGRFQRGSITGFFTVLVEGDDMNEPIADAVRGILDGHIVLSRALGQRGHYPAIDVLQSVSRLATRVSSRDQVASASKVRALLAELEASEDLVRIGAYAAGANPKLDVALRLREQVESFLRQGAHEHTPFSDTIDRLQSIAHAA